jgi:hypothetical protein
LVVAAALSLPASVAHAQDTLVVNVKTDSGRPLPEALVRIRPSMEDRNPPRTSTDAAGIARLAPVPSDTFSIDVMAIGFHPQRLRVTAHGDRITVTLVESELKLTDVCLTYAQPAVLLLIDSAVTPGSVKLTARVRDGSFSETQSATVPGALGSLWFAYERAGTYDVEVTAPGYERWRRSDVRVTRGPCHVASQVLRVRLRPAR